MGKGIISSVSGPVVNTKDTTGIAMSEEVRIGEQGLIGEVIEVHQDQRIIQVYEDTTGLQPGAEVRGTGIPLSVELGPGMISKTFDGIQRPLKKIRDMEGIFISPGLDVDPLDRTEEWEAEIKVSEGDRVGPNSIIAEVEETSLLTHKIMVPPEIEGEIKKINKQDSYHIDDTICIIKTKNGEKEIKLFHKWPVRKRRPFTDRLIPEKILFTGQRVIDFLFPIAKGGVAAIPGGFGTGKTVTQHSLAKWADADVIIYIGCGERGNEMAQVLEEFPELEDPHSGKSLMERTILIANTSNMPVTARESSIYTGITIAEYFRDMGYDVAMMADSTSRWAEALREISGRMEEMPAEKGYPAYLGSRLAEFYERGGRVKVTQERVGSLSVIGAVSPPGGDFSEPVTSHTKRFIRAFWALDKELANARHYPAISWTDSYSEYFDEIRDWWKEQNIPADQYRGKILEILQEEDRLQQIVQLVGEGALPERERLLLKIAELIKEGFLQQNALSEIDAYCSVEKQYNMIKLILKFDHKAREMLDQAIPLFKMIELDIFTALKRMRMQISNDKIDEFDKLEEKLNQQFEKLSEEYA